MVMEQVSTDMIFFPMPYSMLIQNIKYYMIEQPVKIILGSMRSAISDKLLVTFRSENQDYDKKTRQQMNSFSTQSPLKKRCSLSLGINASDPRLPKCEDLYLCDNCGASFQALQEVLVSSGAGV